MPPLVKVTKQGFSLRWQSRGHGFEFHLLYIENQPLTLYVGGFFIISFS